MLGICRPLKNDYAWKYFTTHALDCTNVYSVWFFPYTQHAEKVSITSHFKILLDPLFCNSRGTQFGEVRDYYYYYYYYLCIRWVGVSEKFAFQISGRTPAVTPPCISNLRQNTCCYSTLYRQRTG